MDKLYENEHVHVSVCVFGPQGRAALPHGCVVVTVGFEGRNLISLHNVYTMKWVLQQWCRISGREREGGRREQQLLINLSAFALQSSQSNRIFTLHPPPPNTHIHTQCEHVLFHTFDSRCGQINLKKDIQAHVHGKIGKECF